MINTNTGVSGCYIPELCSGGVLGGVPFLAGLSGSTKSPTAFSFGLVTTIDVNGVTKWY